ncbi:MAG: hypothetical protein QXE50_05960 [Nitrososphaerota archaeon]
MSEEILEDQRCCVESIITEEQAKSQEALEFRPITILDIPAEVSAIYTVKCCRSLGGPGPEIDIFLIEFVDGDIY